jgi:hypothetical protein
MARNQAILRALRGKLNLGVLCAATSAAAFLESSMLLLLGAVAFLGLVVRDVRDDERRKHFFSPRLPEGATFENIAIRNAIDAIGAAQKERLEAVRSCPEDVRRMLGDILRTAALLETAALRLAQRTDRLHGYLSRKDMAGLRDTLYSSQQAAQIARSQPEREIYEATAKSYAIKVETLGAIDVGIRVSLAKLSHMCATLAAVPPRIVKLSAASAEMGDVSYARLSEDLRSASNELQEAEDRFHALALSGTMDDACSDSYRALHLRCGARIAPDSTEDTEDAIDLEDPVRPGRRAASHVMV